MFNKCLMGELRHKTRILVTNQLQFVSPADTAIFMSGGRIAEIGSYSSLMSRGDSFAQLMSQAEVCLLSLPLHLTSCPCSVPCCQKFCLCLHGLQKILASRKVEIVLIIFVLDDVTAAARPRTGKVTDMWQAYPQRSF